MSSQREIHSNALVEAALRLVSQHGWRGLTAHQIAAEAGVSSPMINYYFGSLENLLYETTLSAYEDSVTYWISAASEIASAPSIADTAALRLEALTAAVLEWGEQHSGIAPLLTFPQFGPQTTLSGESAPLTRHPRYIAATERHYQFIIGLMADLINDRSADGTPGHRSISVATSYEWTIFGAMSAWCGQHAYASDVERRQFFEDVIAATVILIRSASATQ